jgi:Kef-type K+ transport system membrane component KefB/mannitol/fructose-specific phosphotransferase system IIA component (Ntr-type)
MDQFSALGEQHILTFLVQVLVLLGLARGCGELFRRWGQPAIVAEILVGVLLGPTVLGRVAPSATAALFPPDAAQYHMLETLAWFGVLFLLLSTGLDVDLSVAWKQGRDSAVIAVSDIVVPLVIGFAAAMLIPDRFLLSPDHRFPFAFFVGTVLTISALPVAIRALHDTNVLRSDMGLLIVSALSINDLIGWVLFTVALGLAAGGVDLARTGLALAAVLGFAAFCLLVGRRAVDWLLRRMHSMPLAEPGASLTFVTLLGLLCGAVTQIIGVHALFGFFLAGIMAGSSRAMSERTREIIHQMVYSIFVPLFFVSIGLRVDFLANFSVPLVLGLAVVGIGGRYLGAWLGSLASRVPVHDRVPIAIAHTPGGDIEIVVALLAVELGLISQHVFVAVMFGAIVSSVLVGPWLAASLKRLRMARTLEFFAPEAFVLDLGSAEPLGAIQELCRSTARLQGMPALEKLYGAVAEREKTMSTALGKGVACPHARLSSVGSPRVVLGLSRSGIAWDAADGAPVHYVFLVLTPAGDMDSQITILAAIARALSERAVQQQLLAAGTADQAWEQLAEALGG